MQTTVIVSVALLAPSEVIESLESLGEVRVTSYSIVNSVGYFVVEEIEKEVWECTDACWSYGRTDDKWTDMPCSHCRKKDYDDNEEIVVWNSECRMCGSERLLNPDGYCSRCWQVWNS